MTQRDEQRHGIVGRGVRVDQEWSGHRARIGDA
jgi:hypothetical protein